MCAIYRTGNTLIDWMLTLESDSALEIIWLLLRFGFNVNAFPKLKQAVQTSMTTRKGSIIVSKIINGELMLTTRVTKLRNADDPF